jgi:membrane protease YdiL (CAAX protease family)
MDRMPTHRPLLPDTLTLAGLKLDTRVTLSLILGTLLLLFDAYHSVLPGASFEDALLVKAAERSLLYLAIPLVLITLVFRDRPAEYGLSLGDWRAGLKWAAVFAVIGAPLLILTARTPAMIQYYDRFPSALGRLIPTAALDLIGWEFFFRGFLLFGLLRLMGPTAVVVQAVPFALAHLGKPGAETFTTIFGGILFGWLAWRSRSVLYPFLLHWFVYSLVIVAAQV